MPPEETDNRLEDSDAEAFAEEDQSRRRRKKSISPYAACSSRLAVQYPSSAGPYEGATAMPYIKPTREQIMNLAESNEDGPVVMLNLLKFAKTADDATGKTGAESYATYGEKMREIMAERGIELLWRGRADFVVIGDDDADGWDVVLLVRYPSRKVFLEMAASKEYGEVGEHRTAALIDSRLIACTEQFRAKG